MSDGGVQGDLNSSQRRQAYWDERLRGASRGVWEDDRDYFLHQALSTPVLDVLEGAEGIYIVDLHGNRYIDMHGNGVHNVGFNNPAVIAAVRAQLESGLTFCPRRYTNAPAVALARRLCDLAPGDLSRCLFCPGGSEAIEMALAVARGVTGRLKTIAFRDAFHGATMGAAAVGGQVHFSTGLPPGSAGAFHVDFPDYERNRHGLTGEAAVDDACLAEMAAVFAREGDIAAVVAEPVSAEPRVPTKRYWEGVRDLCDQHGALLIFDEIIEGLGRTGKLFACEHFVVPDVLVLGKSLGGGVLPLAGIVVRERHNVLGHLSVGHYTHEKNALSAAAGLAALAYLVDHGLPAHAAREGERARQRLHEMVARLGIVAHVRGLGLHMGVELMEPDGVTPAVDAAEEVMYRCMVNGLAFKTIAGNILTLRPALTITSHEMDGALAVLEDALASCSDLMR